MTFEKNQEMWTIATLWWSLLLNGPARYLQELVPPSRQSITNRSRSP